MNVKRFLIYAASVLILVVTGVTNKGKVPSPPKATSTSVTSALKITPTPTLTPAPPTATSSVAPTSSPASPTAPSATPSPQGSVQPYPSAPLCSDHGSEHDNSLFHELWDSTRGCHYDHEHGQNPFTPEIASAFPGFNLRELLGNVGIGHTNPSSPAENVAKHGGFKWQVDVAAPQGCLTGFEGGTVAIDAYAIQFHAFGRQDIEHEARNHSSAILLRQCKSDNPSDKGYIYVTQLQEYGVRVMPYQGMVLPYPDNFLPIWDGRRGQYFTTECFGADFSVTDPNRGSILVDCRPAYNDQTNNLTIWTSKITGRGERPPGSTLFTLLFRGRDNYQRMDGADLVHPFTWRFVCGGLTFNPAGCRYNSSTMTIHEIAGRIPAAWDNLAGFDRDTRPGRITADGFVTRFGDLNLACTAPGTDCHPIKLVGAFVGMYSSEISAVKVSNPTPLDTPERDIYLCNGVPCSETSPGAIPSGWIGSEN